MKDELEMRDGIDKLRGSTPPHLDSGQAHFAIRTQSPSHVSIPSTEASIRDSRCVTSNFVIFTASHRHPRTQLSLGAIGQGPGRRGNVLGTFVVYAGDALVTGEPYYQCFARTSLLVIRWFGHGR